MFMMRYLDAYELSYYIVPLGNIDLSTHCIFFCLITGTEIMIETGTMTETMIEIGDVEGKEIEIEKGIGIGIETGTEIGTGTETEIGIGTGIAIA